MPIHYRKATRADLPHIVRLLADDPLGKSREQYTDPVLPQYENAFDAIDHDHNHYLLVVESDHQIIGTLQLTFITHMVYQGGKRAQIEGVRIDKSYRGKGIGKDMFEWAINKAKAEGCYMVQLTTDKKRPDAIEFYKKLGFIDSHEGMKLLIR